MKWLPDEQRIQIDFTTRQLNLTLESPADLPPRPLASLTNESTIPLQPPPERKIDIDPAIVAAELQRIEQEARLAERELPLQREEEDRKLRAELHEND